jgi:hypothetical protein
MSRREAFERLAQSRIKSRLINENRLMLNVLNESEIEPNENNRIIIWFISSYRSYGGNKCLIEG